ncbi:hypothetical protein N7530_002389 [Penicillium desertorum]|uniref:Uncharacterized protein n=2 Tax=Penicillium desertorum TaxID=1303715 RepID=A0A9X0BT02_9EURO|nr:hypothetical protein N7530_002389 [Penicillium desertorum]
MALSSNEKRALWRRQCREALATHIFERLGLTVAPGRVRLQPSMADGYAWSVSKSQEHLLKSNLSDGTVGSYKKICDALGRSIEAVSPQTLREHDARSGKGISDECPNSKEPPKLFQTASGSGSFTATIQRLEDENQELVVELERAQAYSEKLLEERREWEAKCRGISEELDDSKSVVKQLENDLSHAYMGIAEAMKTLKGLQLPEKSTHEHETTLVKTAFMCEASG